jgi:hypothetical protein
MHITIRHQAEGLGQRLSQAFGLVSRVFGWLLTQGVALG